jgi:uncharacterized membrane protein
LLLRIHIREEVNDVSTEEMTPEESAVEGIPEDIAESELEAEELVEEVTESAQEDLPEPTRAWKAEDATDNDRLMAALAYASQVVVPVLVPAIMLLAEESKERPFQKFHAVQSLGFLVVALVYEVLAAIVYVGLGVLTSGCLVCVLWPIFLVPVLPALYYAYRAYQGLYFKIPLLTDFLVQSKWLEMPPR